MKASFADIPFSLYQITKRIRFCEANLINYSKYDIFLGKKSFKQQNHLTEYYNVTDELFFLVDFLNF